MSNLPLVSVITVYCNREDGLEESVRSVLSQTYKNIEYIVIDDCSTDSTYDRLLKFSDSKLSLLRNSSNKGFTSSLISAISASKGELIAIHGAGDFSHETRIEKQVAMLVGDESLGLIGCGVSNVDFFSKETRLHESRTADGNYWFTHGEVMFRRSTYDHIGGYYSWCKYGQFSGLKYRFEKCSKLGFVEEVLYDRMFFKDGVSQTSGKIFLQKFYIDISKQLALVSGDIVFDEAYLPYVSYKRAIIYSMYSVVQKVGFIAVKDSQRVIIRNNSIVLYFFYMLFFRFRKLSILNRALILVIRAVYYPRLSIRKLFFFLRRTDSYRQGG